MRPGLNGRVAMDRQPLSLYHDSFWLVGSWLSEEIN